MQAPRNSSEGKAPRKQRVQGVTKRNRDVLCAGVGIARILEKRSDLDECAAATWAQYQVKTTDGHLVWITDGEAERVDYEKVEKFEAKVQQNIKEQEKALKLRWLQCEACDKWRVVTPAEEHQFGGSACGWTCAHNKDKSKNTCAKKQDKRALWPILLAQNPGQDPKTGVYTLVSHSSSTGPNSTGALGGEEAEDELEIEEEEEENNAEVHEVSGAPPTVLALSPHSRAAATAATAAAEPEGHKNVGVVFRELELAVLGPTSGPMAERMLKLEDELGVPLPRTQGLPQRILACKAYWDEHLAIA